MKIVQKRSNRGLTRFFIWFLVIAALVALFLISISPNLEELLNRRNLLGSIIPDWAKNDLPVLIVDMPFDGYDRILRQREDGLSKGVILAGNSDFVQADIYFEGQTVPVELRLQQGPARHLGEDEKWNFDGRTRNDQLLSGMQRFYLIDPADNNWLDEAVFSAALRREGLVSGRYQFVHVYLNGVDKGIYALQEGFGQEIITSNNREEGVIVEFDMSPLWEGLALYNGDQGALASDPVSNLLAEDFQYFQVDTFRDAAIAEDEVLTRQKNRAIELLRGLQDGELAASEVFDVAKYGRFLALIDLWGALDATSLVNLRYYYNPQTDRLEPIGFNGNPLSSNERLSLSATFGDFDLQRSYAEEAARLSESGYVDELENELGPEYELARRELTKEGQLTMPWKTLKERQEEISRSLAPGQPILAFLGSPTLAQEGIIQIDIANALNLPIEVLGFNIDGATFIELDPDWIKNNQEQLIFGSDSEIYLKAQDSSSSPLRYLRIQIPLTEILSQDNELDFMHELDIQIAIRIAGLDDVRMVSAETGYPVYPILPIDAAVGE